MSSATSTDIHLLDYEIWWRDHYDWLKDQGYVLRARYSPKWVPSWKDKPGYVFSGRYEDGQSPIHSNVLDAVQPDGRRVCLKRISKSKDVEEYMMAQFFSSSSLAQEKDNHCVPLLEKSLEVPDDSDLVLLVMPVLRAWELPPLRTIGESVDFIRQLFEAVHFMHKQGVAHRDIKWDNVMMDGSELFPDGFHFIAQDRRADFTGPARHFTRTEKPPKYYLIDFGHARQYDLAHGPPLDLPAGGGDKTVPEYQGDNAGKPCDPFKVDIYCTGNLLRRYFTEGYRLQDFVQFHAKSGFGFLEPLVADMVQDDPSKRPTMEQVVERFETIRKSLSSWKLRSRLAEKREWAILSLARTIPHWARSAGYIARRLPATPVD